jgi:3-(3-hydroxy-phenyl)propionate hydroxylase/6-hydroxy-3-succinoylpyridine 3-monooxygenase
MFLFVFRAGTQAIPDDIAAHKAVLRREFADAGWECPQILDAMDATDTLYFDVVSQVRMPRWSTGRVALAGDAAHVTNPTGGFGLTTGLFDAYALWPTLAAVILDGADPALLDRWAGERRQIFLERTSPQATDYKRFVFHANGGGAELEAALDGMRAMARDDDVRFERLMFTKALETTSPAER